MSRAFARLAMLVIIGQCVLTLGVLVICDVPTKRVHIYILGRSPEAARTTVGLGHIYRGFPIPWSEGYGYTLVNADEIERRESVYIGYNVAVPAALLVLAVCVPILVAVERTRCHAATSTNALRSRGVRALRVVVIASSVGTVVAHELLYWAVPATLLVLALCVPVLLAFEWRRYREMISTSGSRTRGARALCVVVFAASTGTVVSFVDVLTDPNSNSWGGVGQVPLHRVPGSWLMIPSGSTTPASVPLPLKEIRAARRELFGPTDETLTDTELAADAWGRRTQRTLLGIGFGFVLGAYRTRRKPATGEV